VLSNLIGNSLLHGFDGRDCGAIRIEGRREVPMPSRCFIDDGVGM
jgi:two-component sensor histidine kinase